MEDTYCSRKGKKCVIYIRVSSERQVKGYSLEGQKRYLKEWAEFEGMTVSNIYVEPGKSGKSITGREVFQMMLNDISSGSVVSDGTLWEVQTALFFRWTCLPDCAVPELAADYRRNNRRLS